MIVAAHGGSPAPPPRGRSGASSGPPAGGVAMDTGGRGPSMTAGEGAVAVDREALVARYAHLVKYVVGRLGVSIPGVFDHEDAMQTGVMGLLRAIDGYRPELASSFESYAIVRIRGAILDAIRALDQVGRAGREAARAIAQAMADLQEELGRSPDEAEVAARLGLSLDRYRDQLALASVATVSLDEIDPRHDDEEGADPPAEDAADPAAELDRREELEALAQEVGRLTSRQQLVLSLYYRDGLTFKEIGAVLGVTESRVCQIHTEAILALRSRLLDPSVAHRVGRRIPRRRNHR
jgi:RNA polymerase sigma factor for flagellar operon FliA